MAKQPAVQAVGLTASRSRRVTKSSSKALAAKSLGITFGSPKGLVGLYTMAPTDRVAVVKRGVPANSVAGLARAAGQSKENLIALLGLSRPTVDRKVRANQSLSIEQGERVVGFARLVGQVQLMIEQSGDPAGFDAAKWVSGWLEQPLPALGGQCPAEYMDTAEGQQIVSRLIAKAQSGAFA